MMQIFAPIVGRVFNQISKKFILENISSYLLLIYSSINFILMKMMLFYAHSR